MSEDEQTTVRQLGPADGVVVRHLVEEEPQTALPGNEAANELYRSLGGTASQAVMWDFAYAGS